MKVKWKQLFSLRNLFAFLFTLVVESIVFFILFYCNGTDLYNAMNSAFLTGFIFLLITGLFFVIQCGAFDVMTLGFSNMFSSMWRNNKPKYESLYDYRVAKSETRKANLYLLFPFISSSSLFIIASLIFRVLWKASL